MSNRLAERRSELEMSNIFQQFVTDVKVYNSYFESDHRFLVLKLPIPSDTIARFRSHKLQNTPKYNIQAHKKENLRVAFCDKLESKMMCLNSDSNYLEESNNVIVSSLAKAYETI